MSQERSVRDVSGLYTGLVGGADGIRTHDLLDAIEARSQLRHGPTEGVFSLPHSLRLNAQRPTALPGYPTAMQPGAAFTSLMVEATLCLGAVAPV